jgi:hypothetical protein
MSGLVELFEPGQEGGAIVIAAIHAMRDMIGHRRSDDSRFGADDPCSVPNRHSQKLMAQ